MNERPRILVVEDYDSVRRVTAHTLRLAGYDVEEAASLKEARQARLPDLIIADHQLEEGHTSKDVAVAWPHVPIIVFSGWPTPEGYVGIWLRKPVVTTDLLAAVRQALENRP